MQRDAITVKATWLQKAFKVKNDFICMKLAEREAGDCITKRKAVL